MDSLKASISGDLAFGVYLKSDRAAYRALRNAFNGGQTSYRALSETAESLLDRDLQRADQAAWARLSDETEKVLREKSKDIEVFVWFTAAQIHLPKAIRNTAAALGVLTDLVESNWDDLHPIAPVENAGTDGEVSQKKQNDAAKLRIFLQLVGEVPRGGLLHLPLINLPLFQEVSHGQLIVAEKDGMLEPIRSILKDCIAADSGSISILISQFQEFLFHAVRLNEALRPIAARCGESPVPVVYLIQQIEDILRFFKMLSEGTGLNWPHPPGEAETAPEAEPETSDEDQPSFEMNVVPAVTASSAGLTVSHATPANREAALDAIAELAQYFRTTEPQSPVHLMLDRALRWGRMSIVELYAELLGEGSESYNRLSLVSGMESFEHSSRAGRPAPSQRVKLPDLGSYSSPLSDPHTAVASARRHPDPIPVQDRETPEPAKDTASDPDEDVSEAPNSQQITEAPVDLPVRSFEW